MKSNGLVVWLIGGVGCVLMYAAIKGATIADVLAGKAASTSAKAAGPTAAQRKAQADKAVQNVPGAGILAPSKLLLNLDPMGRPIG